jgi:hypothetical protein
MTPTEIEALADRVAPMLAGHAPEDQGAVLADLLARWLAGHIVRDDAAETSRLRGNLLTMHVAAVRQLIPPNARKIHGR